MAPNGAQVDEDGTSAIDTPDARTLNRRRCRNAFGVLARASGWWASIDRSSAPGRQKRTSSAALRDIAPQSPAGTGWRLILPAPGGLKPSYAVIACPRTPRRTSVRGQCRPQHLRQVQVTQRRLKMLIPPGPTKQPATMSRIPKMICPWMSCTTPMMTRMAAMTQRTVVFIGELYPRGTS